MKIVISEKQNKNLLGKYLNQEIKEEDVPTSTGSESGSTETSSGGTGYPEVGKWESGVTRGPSNQIGNTKWSDVVGSTLKRDKANKLK